VTYEREDAESGCGLPLGLRVQPPPLAGLIVDDDRHFSDIARVGLPLSEGSESLVDILYNALPATLAGILVPRPFRLGHNLAQLEPVAGVLEKFHAQSRERKIGSPMPHGLGLRLWSLELFCFDGFSANLVLDD